MGCNGSKQQQQQAPNLLQTPAAPNADAAAKAAVADVALEGDYKVTLERASAGADESLGLTIKGDADGAFTVLAVKDEGMVPAYNKKPETPLEQQVKVGDMIVAVNSAFRDLVAMKKQLAEQSLVLSVKRQPEAQQEAAEAAPAVALEEAQQQAEEAPVAVVVDTTENAAATEGVVEEDGAQSKAADAAAAAITEEPPAAVAEPAAVDADAVAAASSSSEAAAAPKDAPVAAATTLGEAPPAMQNDEGFVPVVPEELEANLEGGKCSVCC